MRRLRTLTWAALACILLGGCGAGTQAPPEAGYRRGGLPALQGARVAVFPVQLREGGHADLDREVRFALSQAGPDVVWVLPEEMRSAIERNPATNLQIDNLPVRGFLAGELQRVGDPLFGNLYRLGVVTGASYALIPVLSQNRTRDEGTSVEIAAAILDVRTGDVLWYGIVAGDPGPPGELSASASAADALARAVLP